MRRNCARHSTREAQDLSFSPCNAAARAGTAQTQINPLKPKDVKQAATKASPQGPKRETLPKQTSGHCGALTHTRPSVQLKHALRQELVLNHKVLRGVLYPEAHNNGLQKKKNGLASSETATTPGPQ